MNPGPVEEGAKVATGFFESMKSQPLALALAVCNIMIVGLLWYVAKEASETREREFSTIMENNKGISQLLYGCTPVPGGPRLDGK